MYNVGFAVFTLRSVLCGLSPFAASLLLTPGYILGGILGPGSGRVSGRIGARLPASIGLAFQIAGMLVYSTLSLTTPLGVAVLASVLNGRGSGFFFPANSGAVMANAPSQSYGVASGLLRTFANVGMVGSFAAALLASSAAINREEARAIFLGTNSLGPELAGAFVRGLRGALLTAIVTMAIALARSILRGTETRAMRSAEHTWPRSPTRGLGDNLRCIRQILMWRSDHARDEYHD